jgi:hypothetical protein
VFDKPEGVSNLPQQFCKRYEGVNHRKLTTDFTHNSKMNSCFICFQRDYWSVRAQCYRPNVVDRYVCVCVLVGGWVGGVDWIRLAQDRDQWRAVVSAVMNVRVLTPRN